MIGVVSPSRRLNSRATRFGSIRPRRVAASPTRNVSSSLRNTTDGMAAVRLPKDCVSACPFRHVAAAVNVVPRSMPSVYILDAPLVVERRLCVRFSRKLRETDPQPIVMVGDNRVTGRTADVIGQDPTNVDNLSIAAVN